MNFFRRTNLFVSNYSKLWADFNHKKFRHQASLRKRQNHFLHFPFVTNFKMNFLEMFTFFPIDWCQIQILRKNFTIRPFTAKKNFIFPISFKLQIPKIFHCWITSFLQLIPNKKFKNPWLLRQPEENWKPQFFHTPPWSICSKMVFSKRTKFFQSTHVKKHADFILIKNFIIRPACRKVKSPIFPRNPHFPQFI